MTKTETKNPQHVDQTKGYQEPNLNNKHASLEIPLPGARIDKGNVPKESPEFGVIVPTVIYFSASIASV